jgi:hypothetical protein
MKRKSSTAAANAVSRASKHQKSGEATSTTPQTRLSLRISKRLLDQATKNERMIKNEDTAVEDDHSNKQVAEQKVQSHLDDSSNPVELQGEKKKGKIQARKPKVKKEGTPTAVEDEDGPTFEEPLKKKKRRAKKPLNADPSVEVKKQKAKAYGIVWGVSPYPKMERPTAEECHEVVNILSKYHGDQIAAKAMPPPSLTRAGCGDVPAVHDALLRTLLSSATQTQNANAALDNLVKVYGVAEAGVGKGSINWDAIRLGSQDKLFKTIQCAGLAGGKSRDIKKILDQIVLENKDRCEKLVASGKTLTEDVSRIRLLELMQLTNI